MQKMYSAQWATWLLLPLLAFVVSCNNDDEDGEPPRPAESLFDIIRNTEGLDSLRQLIDPDGGLANRLASTEHTVFAPNNTAFANLLQSIGLESMSELSGNILSDVIFYHLVPNATYEFNEIDSAITTYSRSQIFPVLEGDSIRLNENTQLSPTYVVTPDLQASNGVVHILNEVLLPPSLTSSSNTSPSITSTFGTVGGLTSTVELPGLGGVTTMENLFINRGYQSLLTGTSTNTFLTPVNGAFNGFFFISQENAENTIDYHVIEGNADFASGRTINTLLNQPIYMTRIDDALFLNGIRSLDLGFTANNGRIVHLLGVLRPAEPLADVVDLADESSGASYTIFRTALEETGIDLGTDKTILMPTDAAFEAAGLVVSIDSTARLDPSLLTSVLQTHVFEGINFSSDIAAAESLTTPALNGTSLTITLVPGEGGSTITVDDANDATETANVVDFDYLSTSGVIHAIDQVLLPNP
ncbi:fasciclin domain-containing protein [Tunicatimonas pelagia]|uniref:fasciclin domain-containing protein n=1 Tax=Tunicatimonas pelagia TaxID=931531 RepID=UPI00266553D1|nr:fasciclin domain-containing protein [Tunicatimonas pelagia]WKN44405.1 fasciclin domain-containing protein [Tunicatimonas pelagia]